MQRRVGKRGGESRSARQADIDATLVDLCVSGSRVVRLKGGCPSTFSRVDSEARRRGIQHCILEVHFFTNQIVVYHTIYKHFNHPH